MNKITKIRTVGLVFALAIAGRPARAQIGSVVRPFPDTSGQILIFADQLPDQPTTGQWNFIASHYVGCQKELLSWTQTVRQINPQFIVLHYQLAVGCGTADFIDGNTWTNDFPYVSQHDDWFLLDSGSRIEQTTWDWYVMNIVFSSGAPISGFPSYWTSAAVQRLNDNQNDGVFADSYTVDVLFGQVNPAYSWFNDVTTCLNNWIPNLNQYGAYCASALHSQPQQFYYLPNLGGLITSWDTTNYAVGDGGMNEGFAIPNSTSYYALSDWQLQMSRILALASQGKIVIGQSYINTSNNDQRWFVVGCHLLTKGNRTYLNMFDKSTLEWYPEYTVPLGTYVAAPVADLSQYWNSAWGVYQRNFANGMVLVNPSTTAVTINLDGTYLLVRSSGGGAVPGSGSQPGSLSTSAVTKIKIPAHSARVLLTD
jgi:Hypothetical glycosyl hydrolase family 15